MKEGLETGRVESSKMRGLEIEESKALRMTEAIDARVD
jgi:hypothetical protein